MAVHLDSLLTLFSRVWLSALLYNGLFADKEYLAVSPVGLSFNAGLYIPGLCALWAWLEN